MKNGQTRAEHEVALFNADFFRRFVQPTDWAYMAGIVDGEGTIGIARSVRRPPRTGATYTVYLMVVNTDLPLLDWLQTTAVCGSITACSVSSVAPGVSKKKCLRWTVQGRQCETLLPKMQPYLRIKRRQAEVALSFFARLGRFGGGRVPTEEESARLALYEQMKAINQGLA